MTSALTDLQRQTIARLDSRLEQIALLPSVVSQLSSLDVDAPGSTERIVAIIRSDPTMALRLMRLANTTGGRGRETVDTIPDAILKVGTHGLANLILALSVVDVFAPQTRGQRNLWIHSIQTALTARRLAALRPEFGLTPEECFLAGLLHDIGRFFIFENSPEELAQIDEAHVSSPLELVAAEMEVCGFDHTVLGYEACCRWKLPETVCEMVRLHHCYGEQRDQVPEEVQNLVLLVQEADCFSFGLLQHPPSPDHTDEDRARLIEQSLRPLAEQERILSTRRLANEWMIVDSEARISAETLQIAYS